jgi:tetraacyldisaccharide 4'-kinase
LTWIAARVYGVGTSIASARADRVEPERLDLPVISIGNITAGGTGKTPFAVHLAGALRAGGARPAIALRGYRAESTGGSDEAADYARLDPDLPVLLGRDRASSVRSFLAHHGDAIDVVLLDDGFQHRQLHRDLDIVLIDATRPGLDGDLLPNGWLREPPGALARADLVVLTRATGDDHGVEDLVARLRGSPPEVACRHAWDHIDIHERGELLSSIDEAPGCHERVAVASGIGNPEAFAAQVIREGFQITEHLVFRDHAAYDDRSAGRIAAAGERSGALLVSGKDWVKLREIPAIATLQVPVLVPNVRIEFLRGADTLVARLLESCGHAVAL